MNLVAEGELPTALPALRAGKSGAKDARTPNAAALSHGAHEVAKRSERARFIAAFGPGSGRDGFVDPMQV